MTATLDLTSTQRIVLDVLINDDDDLRVLQIKRALPGEVPVATIRRLLTELIEAGFVQTIMTVTDAGNTVARYRLADGLRCPGDCGHLLDPKRERNALSRFDNGTWVCSSCCSKEAMAQFVGGRVTAPGVTSW